jgi:hypothetical protein
MCGIVGVYHLNGSPVPSPLLRRMTDVVAHRGPDGDSYYIDGAVGLGHRRLAIIDLSPAGRQPMGNVTGDIILIYNAIPSPKRGDKRVGFSGKVLFLQSTRNKKTHDRDYTAPHLS